MPIHNKIRKWKNVTYQIEWYADGKEIFKDDPFCEPPTGKSKNDIPCPDKKEIHSTLKENYQPGQWVRIYR